MTTRIRERNQKELQKAFEILDQDQSGKISMQDLKRVVDRQWDLCESEEERIDDETLSAMIQEASSDGDDQIDMKEFMRIITPCLLG